MLSTPIRRSIKSYLPHTTFRNIRKMSTAEFIATALKADSSLAGSSDKDKSAISKLETETEGLVKDLKALDDRLTPLTYLHSNSPSTADVSLYCHLYPSIASAQPTQHQSQPSILRYFLHIQSLPPVQTAQQTHANSFQPINIDLSSLPQPIRQAPPPPPKKEKKAKAATAGTEAGGEGILASVAGAVEGAAAAVSGAVASVTGQAAVTVSGKEGKEGKEGKKEKEKKEKKEKPAKAPAPVETGPLPSMIDMRVGKVLEVSRHPDADSLYVEKIDIGEAEPRTVCSGLVKYMKEEEILGATIIVICNLKPVTMRGVKSYAMLLCASSRAGKEEGGVEFVLPPAGSQPGERIYIEGEKYENAQPEGQLNPKKKVFETIQPGFLTLDNLEAAWVDPETKSVHKIRTKDGVCKAKSFVGASLS